MNPLDGLDDTEREWLKALAVRDGITLEEARARRDEMGRQVSTALEPYREELAEASENERHMLGTLRAVGIKARGVWQAMRLARAGQRSRVGGGAGGRQPKRREWAVMAAEHAKCWEDFPGPENPLEFEDWIVYRDGDRLVAVDQYNDRETSLARSTVEKRYLK